MTERYSKFKKSAPKGADGVGFYDAEKTPAEKSTSFSVKNKQKSSAGGIVLFEDADQRLVFFEDVDDTYLNQRGLVDHRVEILRRRWGRDLPPPPPQGSGVIEFIDADEDDQGTDYLDADVDTLIKKLVAQSKKRSKSAEDPDVSGKMPANPPSYTHPPKAALSKRHIAEVEGLITQSANDGLLGSIFNAVASGKSTITHSHRNESIIFDDKWIIMIEDGLFFIEEIVKNPRKFIIDNEIIMEVERAKKTNSKTVRHLAQNTKNISHIDEDGFVMPKKVLTTEMDEDLAIYENRFICTLINRLVAFVELRKTDIEDHFKTHDISQLMMKSNFKFGVSDVECNFSVTVKEPPVNTPQVKKAMVLMEKINNISKRLRILKTSFFVRKLSTLKPLAPPIQKTNIIKMNVNYSTSYKLWLFISSYTLVGYSVDVKEKNLPVDGDYYDDLAAITSLSMRSVITHEIVNREAYEKIEARPPKTYKYKVVPEYDFVPDAKDITVDVHDEAINEYYFRKMQEMMEEKESKAIAAAEENAANAVETAAANAVESTVENAAETADENTEEIAGEKLTPKNIILHKQNLVLNYERMCRSLMKISNEVLSDTLKKESDVPPLMHNSAYIRKKNEYERQKNLHKKFGIISKIKAEDLEKAIKEESSAEIKLVKLEHELQYLETQERGKARTIKAKPRTGKTQAELVYERASQYREQTLGQIASRQEAEEFLKQQREQHRREKDLRYKAMLKEKYNE